ncbi:UDP-N-acetylglucosamine 2-epimerase [Thioalkalivibrio nitratireducens DSM 14787]|uniref:UDP-N-acetylglucosamine 2-epimerase n=1 Tax=Thioalkalivibrio nitratireducens (strain DSM 14787 / UNIQEM 213 / ALEN2) TaxID=1255043 RepID=L0DS42_THIND|nr:UDP-N-acetylglucosamine 2-epimerase (non-hydrolyzing) [Thioalkalivibrio nitratireducens]AGA32394.1 UDP-N-acetylglucosamine 2-epimerase [Thioalkalivibrio nitratireducens DSM 14787]
MNPKPTCILTVVGARPQFIKAAAVARALEPAIAEKRVRHVLVHTGQHYDQNMSELFFEQLDIPRADINLGIGGGGHGRMTGAMLEQLEPLIEQHRPDWVLTYGDTNSTLAAGLAAAKLHRPVAHVEAGLRSFNRRMPEEINRVLVDHLSDRLFCPTTAAVDNLSQEGIREGVHLVGDVMYDVALFYRDRAASRSLRARFGLEVGGYFLSTCHRAENTDDPSRLRGIFAGLALAAREAPVVLPLHPRTRARMAEFGVKPDPGVHLIEPVGYLEMLDLEAHARAILTDSGGIQKEAYFYGVPCITLRTETEWVETVSAGWNTLVDAHPERIAEAIECTSETRHRPRPELYGCGDAARRIVDLLLEGKE